MRGPFPEMRIIFTEEFRRQVINPGFIFVTAVILVPTVAIVVMVAAGVQVGDSISVSFKGGLDDEVSESLERTGYVDQAGALPGPGLQDAPKRYNDSPQGIEAVRQGEIDTLFILTADYLESGAVEQYGTSSEGGGRFSGNSAAESAFSDFLRVELIVGQVEADTLARVSKPGHYRSFHVAADGTITTAIRIIERTVGLIILAVLFPIAAMIGASATATSFTEDNETRMVEMLATSAPAFSVMAGKLAALVATGLVYIAVWITVAAFVVPAVVGSITSGVLAFIMSPELLVTVLAAFVLGYFLYSTLGLLVGVLVPSPVQAQRRMSILALFAGLPVGTLIADPLDVFTPILPYIPLTAPAMVFLRLAQGDDVSDGGTAAMLALVAATGLLLLWITSRIFRARILLVRPTKDPRQRLDGTTAR